MLIDYLYRKMLSEQTKRKSERVIITVAIISFLLHLGLIGINEVGNLNIWPDSDLLKSPIAAIYTPFSFILIYEVYLLVYYLPKSISQYISKQYEIITLVVIRRIFKDLANLNLVSDWFENTYDLQLTFDIITTVVLFGLILLFGRLNKREVKGEEEKEGVSATLKNFIFRKKSLAVLLVPIFLTLAFYSFGRWVYSALILNAEKADRFGDINDIFFNEFFTVLILADVLLLLFSLFHTDKFNTVIRNSGFIISTILIRLSFSVEGITNNILIISAVSFGVLILALNNNYDKEAEGSNA
ncbi:MAG: hypothetical protein KJO20_14035 [Eudoraea sp.]|nr:hypothetical protein [Eudoraea sp.]